MMRQLSAEASASATRWPEVPGYEIVDELGRGGMGIVYKARQVRLQRLVAVKLIRDTALAAPHNLARFRIEIEAAARMQHPNIVEIYDAGEHAGQPYLAMELITGLRLDQQLSGRPQPPRQAADLIRMLALAVQHAHAQQVVHRDLKPANVMLQKTELGPQGSGIRDEMSAADLRTLPLEFCPKITDFGLAKRLDSDSTAFTQDGAILGTASYMAPEQAAGRIQDIGPAVDIYALGAMLYELLSGQPPFRADTWNQTVQQVLYDDPIPPTRLQANVPRDLETVCLKCLEKEPSRRYASAGELAGELGRYLQGEPIAAVPLDERERLARAAARDGFVLAEEIGRGPTSTVYRARFGPSQQPIALKVYAAGTCSREEWDARLRRIRDLGAVVAHPQIVPLQNAGWWNDSPYVVFEFAPHGSLAARLADQDQPLPLREALHLVGQLAEVVRYLHRQGIVHANLKPTNVLFAADGIPRLSDFSLTGGLFQRVSGDEVKSPALRYVAPELIANPLGELRPHTDIYGLGLILYELLTGRSPFPAEGEAETIGLVSASDPVPPSTFNPAVPPPLDAVCLRCLHKNPWRRYARAHDVIKRLRWVVENPSRN
jgi:serine/threonine protein kinase